MRVTTVSCDQCEKVISVVMQSGKVDGDYCSMECLKAAEHPVAEECPHEDNASDAVPGRSTARLVCKECGYDRVEEVA